MNDDIDDIDDEDEFDDEFDEDEDEEEEDWDEDLPPTQELPDEPPDEEDVESSFELHVADTDATSGTIGVSWCLSRDLLKDLAANGVEDPQVVIVVAPEEHFHIKKEYRKVVPLKDLMAYVEFRHPGANRIYGLISYKGKKSARNHYLSKEKGQYESWVLNDEGDDFNVRFKDTAHKHYVAVDVPRECFAAEPSDAEKAWVNHFFRSKPNDQCNFRRRRLFAYLVQPFIMLVNFALRMVMLAVALLLGTRGLLSEWRSLFKILTYSLPATSEVFNGGTYYIRPDKYKDPDTLWEFITYCVKRGWTLPFMPLVAIPVAVVFATYGFVEVITQVGAALGLIAVVVTLFVLIILLGKFIADRMIARAKTRPPRPAKKRKPLWYEEEDAIGYLVCDGNQKPTTVSKLPSKHRTVKLRFHELKSMVCRPFAG